MSNVNLQEAIDIISERIKELQEEILKLKEEKNCNGCRYLGEFASPRCTRCIRYFNRTHKDLYID